MIENDERSVVNRLSYDLYEALCGGHTVAPLTLRHPELSIEDAYGISLGVLARRRVAGEKVIGKKIGVTSRAVQDMLGVH